MAIPAHDPGYRFVAETLLAQLQAMMREAPGVRDGGDIECLHRMRVASRRLRTMLDLFADWLPAKTLQGWNKQMRGITRALGAARDADVQLAFIDQFRVLADETHRPGIARLELRLQQTRDKLQRRILKTLDELEHGNVIAEMEERLRQMRIVARLQTTETDSPLLFTRAEHVITARLSEMLSYEIYLNAPPSADDQYPMLHAMRIAAKHLRYSMSVFEPLYDGHMKEPIKAAKTIQELLGNLHDCDVWIIALPCFLQEEEQRMRQFTGSARGMTRLRPGIKLLLEDRRMCRETNRKEFQSVWRKYQGQQLWQQLLNLLREYNEHPTEQADKSDKSDKSDRSDMSD